MNMKTWSPADRGEAGSQEGGMDGGRDGWGGMDGREGPVSGH